jgi:hypothetical protein
LNSVTWYASPTTPAATNMQPIMVTECGRLFMVCGCGLTTNPAVAGDRRR